MQETFHKKLNLNIITFLFTKDTYEATKYLDSLNISFDIKRSDEGYWINVNWKNGITAGLTYQELSQLPEHAMLNLFKPKRKS